MLYINSAVGLSWMSLYNKGNEKLIGMIQPAAVWFPVFLHYCKGETPENGYKCGFPTGASVPSNSQDTGCYQLSRKQILALAEAEDSLHPIPGLQARF